MRRRWSRISARASDGMKVDKLGNVWTAGRAGYWLFLPRASIWARYSRTADGNCAWGDDGSTLYVTANMFLCRIKTLTKGRGGSKMKFRSKALLAALWIGIGATKFWRYAGPFSYGSGGLCFAQYLSRRWERGAAVVDCGADGGGRS